MTNETDNKIERYGLTPKGKLFASLLQREVDFDIAEEIWLELEGFCMHQLKSNQDESEYAAIIFDGEGGTVIGCNRRDEP